MILLSSTAGLENMNLISDSAALGAHVSNVIDSEPDSDSDSQ